MYIKSLTPGYNTRATFSQDYKGTYRFVDALFGKAESWRHLRYPLLGE